MIKKILTAEEIEYNLCLKSLDKMKEIFFTDWSYPILYHLNKGALRNKELKIKCAPLCDGTLGLRLNMLEENKMILRKKIEINGTTEHIEITNYGKLVMLKFDELRKAFGIKHQDMMDGN